LAVVLFRLVIIIEHFCEYPGQIEGFR